jgi:hypothetical protein
MITWLHWLWQKIRKPLIVIVIVTVCIGAIVLIAVAIWLNGTGFNGYNKVSIAHITGGPSTFHG